jgi:hypothetical protein
MVLFGGTTKLDAGTRQSYDLNDTWEWNSDRWIQDYPAHSPHGRSFHAMVYDTNHSRTILFGGKSGTLTTASVEYNDTWTFDGNDWTQINTPNAPQARIYAGAAFNPIRDRMIIFGGTNISSDGKTTTNLTDTWEFDGTTWTQLAATGPAVLKPLREQSRDHGRLERQVRDADVSPRSVKRDLGTNDRSDVASDVCGGCADGLPDARQHHRALRRRLHDVGDRGRYVGVRRHGLEEDRRRERSRSSQRRGDGV